jgi:hypothetical protein
VYTHCVVFSLSSEAETGGDVATLRADPSLGTAVVGARTRNELVLAADMLGLLYFGPNVKGNRHAADSHTYINVRSFDLDIPSQRRISSTFMGRHLTYVNLSCHAL